MSQNKNTALISGGVILAVLLFLVLGFYLIGGFRGFGFMMMGPSMMGPGMMGGYGVMFLVPILIVVILGIVGWAIVAATQKSSDKPDATGYQTETPLDIVKRRYARGEIDQAEYETKKRDLT